jgi:hypothetical protein
VNLTDAGKIGTWWTSTFMDLFTAKGLRIGYDGGRLYYTDFTLGSARSVRCLKD